MKAADEIEDFTRALAVGDFKPPSPSVDPLARVS
jgi:hypothetical protein